ncbi:MAG TPA: L,D-transpeptidase, partial [Thermomicrobiales bacterium]|nr:L,D-transpeptidase [Thermomicrobiales bacterium]
NGVVVQYFEGAVLQRDTLDNVTVVPLVVRNPKMFRVNTNPVAQNGLPAFDESLFQTAVNPNPIGDSSAPGRKWIEVNLSQQQLWAYQGTTLISTTLVSTGLGPNPTLPGNFHVRYKLPSQDMKGAVNAEGQVVALGQDAADAAQEGLEPNETPYVVEDVPNVMYFNMEAEALHGAYWHNNFGNPMSHGCINLPLNFAAWLYGWAPLGTEVWVHE